MSIIQVSYEVGDFFIEQAILKRLLLKKKNMKWNYRNTLTSINYGYSNIKVLYNGYQGIVIKGSYGTDGAGRSVYIPCKKDEVEFHFGHTILSVDPKDIKNLLVNNQVVYIGDLIGDEDAYFEIHRRIKEAQKNDAPIATAIAS